VGHSLGGGNAYKIAADLSKENIPISLLIAIDPVGSWHIGSSIPNKLPPNIDLAINLYAKPTDANGSDFIAGAGGQYRNLPSRLTSYHFEVNKNHDDARGILRAQIFQGNGRQSAFDLLRDRIRGRREDEQ
jgi:hypothetical protein